MLSCKHKIFCQLSHASGKHKACQIRTAKHNKRHTCLVQCVCPEQRCWAMQTGRDGSGMFYVTSCGIPQSTYNISGHSQVEAFSQKTAVLLLMNPGTITYTMNSKQRQEVLAQYLSRLLLCRGQGWLFSCTSSCLIVLLLSNLCCTLTLNAIMLCCQRNILLLLLLLRFCLGCWMLFGLGGRSLTHGDAELECWARSEIDGSGLVAAIATSSCYSWLTLCSNCGFHHI